MYRSAQILLSILTQEAFFRFAVVVLAVDFLLVLTLTMMLAVGPNKEDNTLYLPFAQLSLDQTGPHSPRRCSATPGISSTSTSIAQTRRMPALIHKTPSISSDPASFSLTKQIRRPHLRMIVSDDLSGLYPHLGGVPVEYVREKVVETGTL